MIANAKGYSLTTPRASEGPAPIVFRNELLVFYACTFAPAGWRAPGQTRAPDGRPRGSVSPETAAQVCRLQIAGETSRASKRLDAAGVLPRYRQS